MESTVNTEENKQKFITFFKNFIKRDGSEKFLEWLSNSDFFEAPASVKYHSNFRGGLCLHSILCFERLRKICIDEFGKDNFEKFYSMETIAICGLLHDICKVDFYKEDMRNVKENGVWISVPYFTVDDKLPYGHGEKSVYILQGFMRLSREEAMAINWHMGGFDQRVQGGSYSVGEAFDKHTLALLLHLADMQATYIDENRH